MGRWFQLNKLLERIAPPGVSNIAKERDAVRQSRMRLIALLFLFDALLIVATLLSFQEAELIEEERVLRDLKETVEIKYTREVLTQTMTITEVIPYGSVP